MKKKKLVRKVRELELQIAQLQERLMKNQQRFYNIRKVITDHRPTVRRGVSSYLCGDPGLTCDETGKILLLAGGIKR